MTSLLGALHGLDYIFSLFLTGAILFQAYILPAGGLEAEVLDTRAPRRIRLLLVLTCLSSLTWMILSAQDMADSWAPDDLWAAMAHTGFGHLWCLRVLILLVFSGLPRYESTHPKFQPAWVALALLLPLIPVLSSHAAGHPSRFGWRIAVDWAHAT